MTDPSTTRRGVLTVAGATLLAGCSSLDFSADARKSISALRLRDIVPEGANDPIVVDILPVEIERSKLASSARRVDELLAEFPIPFDSESVPNGYIRRRLTEAADEATDGVAEARTAPSRLVALNALRWARSEARYAAAGWAFVDRDLTEAELRSEHRETVSGAESFRADFEYPGSDPVVAALVYGQAERFLEPVLAGGRPPNNWEASQLLAVAEWGDHAESIRSQLEDARYLYNQYQSTLPEDAGSVDDTLAAGVETLRPDLQRRHDDLPPEPTNDDNQLLWRLRDTIRNDAESSLEQVDEAPGPASALLMATRGLTALLAYDRLIDRIDDGETFEVKTADDVRAVRTTAVEAITSALAASPRDDLARPMLADAARSVGYADERLLEVDSDIRPAQLDHSIAAYTVATLRARSVPPACRTTLNALDN